MTIRNSDGSVVILDRNGIMDIQNAQRREQPKTYEQAPPPYESVYRNNNNRSDSFKNFYRASTLVIN